MCYSWTFKKRRKKPLFLSAEFVVHANLINRSDVTASSLRQPAILARLGYTGSERLILI